MNKQKSILVGGIIGLAFLIAFGFFLSDIEEKIIQPDGGFRVAFIADQDINTNSIAVLDLIKDEGAQLVLHQGDFDYEDDPDKWDRMISNVLGNDFPYLASLGDHDVKAWSGYQEKLYDRLEKNPDVVCNGDLGVWSSCTYQGLFFILIAPDFYDLDYDSFIAEQLNNTDYIWRFCSWHHDMNTTPTYSKPNKTGLEIYEACKDGGAIIANGHKHFYARTKTLINIENQIVDSEWSDLNKLRVKEGATFAFISGLGGDTITPTDKYYDWSTSYVPDIGSTHGALFCTFNAGGQPNKAYCYFKNVNGKIVDEFTVTSFLRTTPDYNNLIDTDMSGLDLAGDDFSNKVIIDSNLSNAILVGADLSNAVLIGTTLMGANLTDANLTGVSLAYKDLTGTILRGADLTSTNLTGIDLSGRDLTGTILGDVTGIND